MRVTHRLVLPLLLSPALALAERDVTDDEVARVSDPGVHSERVDSEFRHVRENRRHVLDLRMRTEGELFTLSIPMFRDLRDDADPSRVARRGLAQGGRSDWETLRAELPRFHLDLLDEEDPVFAKYGTLEATLGHGSLVRDYSNASREGFDLGVHGVMAGARAQGLGGTVFVSDVTRPGRVTGFHVGGRPISWLASKAGNFEPQGAGDITGSGIVMNIFNVGLTGVIDTAPPWRDGGLDARPMMERGTAGGLALELDSGLRSKWVTAYVFADGTVLGRSVQGAADPSHLLGAGGSVGGHFGVDLSLLVLDARAAYHVGTPNHVDALFSSRTEQDRGDGAWSAALREQTVPRHGYDVKVSGQVLKTLGAFLEMNDEAPLFRRDGRNLGTLRAGGTLNVLGIVRLTGAYVNRGFNDYGRAWTLSETTMLLAEERLSLPLFAVVARQWRTHEATPNGLRPRNGQSLVAQVQLGF